MSRAGGGLAGRGGDIAIFEEKQWRAGARILNPFCNSRWTCCLWNIAQYSKYLGNHLSVVKKKWDGYSLGHYLIRNLNDFFCAFHLLSLTDYDLILFYRTWLVCMFVPLLPHWVDNCWSNPFSEGVTKNLWAVAIVLPFCVVLCFRQIFLFSWVAWWQFNSHAWPFFCVFEFCLSERRAACLLVRTKHEQ